jgi:hypothetical protein
MKLLNRILLTLLLSVVPMAAVPPTTVVFDFDFTQTGSSACTVTVTTSCVSAFTVSFYQNGIPGSGTPLGTPTVMFLPTPISTTGPTTNIRCAGCIPTTLTYPGIYYACVLTNWKDSTGAAQVSNSNCVGFGWPSAPVNLHLQ